MSNSTLNIEALERHLKKRVDFLPYIWGGKQNNKMDKATRKIYNIRSFNELIKAFENSERQIQNYAYNRWLNHWSAQAVESFFHNHSNIVKEKNEKHSTIDLYINNIPFDHKTTVLPRYFYKTLNNNSLHTQETKYKLVQWLYKNQSKQQRNHNKNRLFVVLVDKKRPSNSWKMKAELSMIKGHIDQYISDINNGKRRFIKSPKSDVQAGIIIIEK